MLDHLDMRSTLAEHYDLAPSLDLAEDMAALYAPMKPSLTLPDWAMYAPYVAAINRLKKERNAVILAHNYMTPEIFHGISDVVGDSLALAVKAKEVEADVIVQCGVHFMAETSKILNPSKTVLMPDMNAGCSLADSITADGGLSSDRPGRRCCAESVPPSYGITCRYSGTGTPRARRASRAGRSAVYRSAIVASGDHLRTTGVPSGAVANHAPCETPPGARGPSRKPSSSRRAWFTGRCRTRPRTARTPRCRGCGPAR